MKNNTNANMEKPLPSPYCLPYPYRMHMTPNRSYADIAVSNVNADDHGPDPFVINIEKATIGNDTFRTALWTGRHLQLTVMSIDAGGEIGLETHPKTDQFLRLEQGIALVMMGDDKDNLTYKRRVTDGYAVFVPAGKWHNLVNIGSIPIKLYSIYAPPEHPRGTVHLTKDDDEH